MAHVVWSTKIKLKGVGEHHLRETVYTIML